MSKESIIKITDQYCDVWNEPDLDTKKNKLSQIWDNESKYIDPRSNLKGIDELVNHIHRIQAARPGSKIVRTSQIDLHHEIGRFRWLLEDQNGSIQLEGMDIIHFDREFTKIELIVGFFGNLD